MTSAIRPDLNIDQLASMFDVGLATVSCARREFGLPRGKRGPKPKLKPKRSQQSTKVSVKIRDSTIAIYRRRGYTLQSIAGRFGITRERVRQIVRRYNIAKPVTTIGTVLRRIKQCESCGVYGEVSSFGRNERTCSLRCRRMLDGRVGGKWSRQQFDTLTCDYCGIEFKRSRYQASIAGHVGARHTYCCHDHYTKARRSRTTKESPG